MGTTPWHSLNIEEVFKQLGSRLEGLSQVEASHALAHFGRNEIYMTRWILKLVPLWQD